MPLKTSSGDAEREPTRRFTNRVGYYVKYRPDYPPALPALFRDEIGLAAPSVVADVGSGTGKLSRLLLAEGHTVYGVEPNAEMRGAAEALLRGFDRFRSLDGSAEATGLATASVDLVVAAQAFHWFRFDEARREFARILRPAGPVVLIWNRRSEATPFQRAYEDLLRRFAVDYEAVDHRKTTDSDVLSRFFVAGGRGRTVLANAQTLDWEGLRGRLLSCSYAPAPGHPDHEQMLESLQRIYRAHEREGKVRFDYQTEVFWGEVSAESEETGANRKLSR